MSRTGEYMASGLFCASRCLRSLAKLQDLGKVQRLREQFIQTIHFPVEREVSSYDRSFGGSHC